MTYLAIWLLAVALGDLARPGAQSDRRRPWWVGALVSGLLACTLWPLLGQRGGAHLLALVGIVGATAAWAWTSAQAVDAAGRTRYDQAPAVSRRARRYRTAALLVLGVGLVVGFGMAAVDPAVSGPAAQWWRALGVPRLARVTPDRALMVLAVVLLQVGTANVVVRLVLDAAGAHSEPGVLRGGRWLGPMERVFLVGLALAGQATAAAVVVAAKGLLRFPELQDQRGRGQRIDSVTEYFLLGSFTSWLVALGATLLAL